MERAALHMRRLLTGVAVPTAAYHGAIPAGNAATASALPLFLW